MKHQLLYVVRDLTCLKSQRFRQVDLPELNLRITFETSDTLRDLRRVRGTVLCYAAGMGYLSLATEAAVRTRLRPDPCHECPAAAIDLSRYAWL